MYKEPHLQKKSDECRDLWYEWFDLFQKKDPEEKEIRKKWSKCCDEFGVMISQEVKTNPRYKDLQS
jgi:hypothetical protein